MQEQYKIKSTEWAVVETILGAVKEISTLLRNTPVKKLDSTNQFGDHQLHLDVQSDEIIERHLKSNNEVKGFASEERPEYAAINQGEGGFDVTYDPLDGSSIIDTNFAVGSIFSIWPHTPNKLIGEKLSAQKNALLAVYGPRTTVLLFNSEVGKVQELTLINEEWVLSHDHCVIKQKTNMFSPGNLRATTENVEYKQIVNSWVDKGYTLRYTGGLVPDVAQFFIKGHGIFSNIHSKNHKAKLRVLFQVAAVGFLIQKAEGSTVTIGKKPVLEYQIKGFDDRISFAAGSKQEVESLVHLF